MASTSTNKQPLLVDRVFHNIVDLVGATIEENSRVDIGGSNSAELVLDCTQNDGAVIGEVYAIARANPSKDSDDNPIPTGGPYTICFYISTANDFLRDSQAFYVGVLLAGGTFAGQETEALEGERVVYNFMPALLAPVPGVGSEDDSDVVGTPFKGIYVPKGRALWAAVNKKTPTDSAPNAPLFAVHGGFF